MLVAREAVFVYGPGIPETERDVRLLGVTQGHEPLTFFTDRICPPISIWSLMVSYTSHNVTQLLIAWNDGDQAALEQLVPKVHMELHKLARRYMGQERAGHVLQPTALVNEAYKRLIDWKTVEWKNRAHFFSVAAQLMRHILVDFARQRPRHAGHTAAHVSLDEALTVSAERSDDLVALDDALNSLAQIDERKSRIVELRFFGGLSNEEIAEVLDISTITVIREWNKAKAWLYRELSRQA